MKKFLKTLAVFATVAALGFGFASCSDDDDGVQAVAQDLLLLHSLE